MVIDYSTAIIPIKTPYHLSSTIYKGKSDELT